MQKGSVFATVMAMVSLLVGGCSDQSKMESACKELTEALVVDPRSVSYNEVTTISSEMSQADLEGATSRRYGGKQVSPESKRYFDLIYKKGENLPRKYWVDIDYTTDSYAGKQRAKVMCTFVVVPGSQKFLASFSSGSRDYYGYGLEALFVGKKLPGSLGGLFDLK